jgi:hypothetical protein
MDQISRTLSIMKPEDLWPSWRLIDTMEQHGRMSSKEAERWKEGIFGLMKLWGLEPDEVLASDRCSVI